MAIYKEPPPGMFVVPDPQDMTKVKKKDSCFPSDMFSVGQSTVKIGPLLNHLHFTAAKPRHTTTRFYFLKIASHVSV